jgi:C-terminal processing protease CtpA/Prc
MSFFHKLSGEFMSISKVLQSQMPVGERAIIEDGEQELGKQEQENAEKIYEESQGEHIKAVKAGVKTGDQILKINGYSTTDLSSKEAIEIITGKVATSVTLLILQGKRELDIRINRVPIRINPQLVKVYDVCAFFRKNFDKKQAIEGYKMAAKLYKQLGKTADYERVIAHLQELQPK